MRSSSPVMFPHPLGPGPARHCLTLPCRFPPQQLPRNNMQYRALYIDSPRDDDKTIERSAVLGCLLIPVCVLPVRHIISLVSLGIPNTHGRVIQPQIFEALSSGIASRLFYLKLTPGVYPSGLLYPASRLP